MSVEVALESAHGTQLHASVAFDDISADWQQYRATLTANATDTTARLAVRLQVTLPSSALYLALSLQRCTASTEVAEACNMSYQPLFNLCPRPLGSATFQALSRI